MRFNINWLLIIIGLSLLSGIVGYYGGYRSACIEFTEQCLAEALSDRVASAVYTLYAYPSDDEESQGEDIDRNVEPQLESTVSESEDDEVAEKVASQDGSDISTPPVFYEARLAGSSAKEPMKAYVNRLKAEGIEARVVTRDTVTSRGRKATWYQVVTAPQPYDQLSTIVAHLKKRDKLKDVSLIEVTQDQSNTKQTMNSHTKGAS